MLTEYVNDHRLAVERELRAVAQARPRYDRSFDRDPSWLRGFVRSVALRPAAATTGFQGTVPHVVIRPAGAADSRALARLAEASERRMPSGLVLVAEVEAKVVAAIPMESGYVLSDLFQPTSDLVQLLELRSGQLRAASLEKVA